MSDDNPFRVEQELIDNLTQAMFDDGILSEAIIDAIFNYNFSQTSPEDNYDSKHQPHTEL